jgi:hypothetical protein
MKSNKFKHRYLRDFIRENKIKEPFLKSGLYGAVFNLPKKIKRSLIKAKNENHRNYLNNLFLNISKKCNSREVIKLLKENNGI